MIEKVSGGNKKHGTGGSHPINKGTKKSQVQNEAAKYKQAGPDYKGAGSNFYTPPTTPTGGTTNKNKKNTNNGAGPAKVNPAVVTSIAVGGQINPNVFEAYIAEIKRLTLKLVNNSKNLLMAYDFKSINSAVDYYLDTDNAAKTQSTKVSRAVPSPNFSLNDLTLQEITNGLINTFAEYLSDSVDDSTRFNYFGSEIAGIWSPGTPSFTGNQAKYDLRINVPVDSRIKNIQISLYEI